jgi:cytochrome bd ubiquinol oxidase subunit II
MSIPLPDFVPVWTCIIGLGIFFYVLLDGFDLGVGMLYTLAPQRDWRTLIMNSVAPIWDGNETWLVLGGVGLLAAFPLVFAILIPALYFPILLILLGLIFRGMAFEFRRRDLAHRGFWDFAFGSGSLLASLAQGIVIGAFIQGFKVDGRQFTGSSFACFTSFSLFCGLSLTAGYGLLGAGWLILKTEGPLQSWARGAARRCLIAVVSGLMVISVWTPLIDDEIACRWFSWPHPIYFAWMPLGVAFLTVRMWRSLDRHASQATPFFAAVGLFVLTYLGIGVSRWPVVIPHHYTLWQAASSPSTQIFLLVGLVALLPVILLYSGWSYWVFRGKVRADIGY